MRLSSTPTTFLSLLVLALSSGRPALAAPLESPDLELDRRGGGNCGADLQFSCTGDQSCTTSVNADGNSIAYCAAATAVEDGGSNVFTTTYTETGLVTKTSTYTSAWAQTTLYNPSGNGEAAICTASLGQQSCGVICCAGNQACAGDGWCTAATTLRTETTAAPGVTSGYSAPLRPTSGGATVSATTTQPFVPPATASGSTLPILNHSTSNGGLSGGAIAGIVIGVLAGIGLLILICFCCIVRTGFHGLLVLLGLRGKDKKPTGRSETVGRSRYSGSGTASRRDTHRGWFGNSKPSRVEESRKKSSSWGGFGAITAGLVALAVVLGLKRRQKRKEQEKRPPPVSDYSSTYYSDYYTETSASSASSDRRTRTDDRRSKYSRYSGRR